MSEKRRDNRNRVLHNGEVQLADGRYRFKYLDHDGEVRYVYSWRLDKNDRTPQGKKRIFLCVKKSVRSIRICSTKLSATVVITQYWNWLRSTLPRKSVYAIIHRWVIGR